MDDLGAAEAPSEPAAASSGPSTLTLPPTTTTTLESPTGEKENADPLQVSHEIRF